MTFFCTLAAGAFCAGLAVRHAIPWSYALAAAVPCLVVVGLGVAFPTTGVFGRVVHRGNAAGRAIALTFDDGPDARWTPALLDLLDQRQQRATFFVIGQRAAAQPALLADMVRRGHEIANHTWSHSFLTPFMPPRALAGELARTNAVIEGATGRTPRWFRPPVGLMSPRVARGAELAGLDIACWSATARDGVARTTAAVALQRLESGLEPGAILVLHDARLAGDREPLALRVVATLLDRMDARGLRSVTLSELCAAPPR